MNTSTKTTHNRFAISDIHGCADTFIELLKKINFSLEDELFILGDLINRGKRSKKVVKTILQLQAENYKIFVTRGNHEHLLIHYIEKLTPQELKKYCKQNDIKWLLDKETDKIKPKYYNFLTQLPYYYVIENFFLSHAGFDLTQDDILSNKEAMIYQRIPQNEKNLPENVIVVHGHSPTDLSIIKRGIENKNRIINIDNGCVVNKNNEKGNLICLNLDTFGLHIQPNID